MSDHEIKNLKEAIEIIDYYIYGCGCHVHSKDIISGALSYIEDKLEKS